MKKVALFFFSLFFISIVFAQDGSAKYSLDRLFIHDSQNSRSVDELSEMLRITKIVYPVWQDGKFVVSVSESRAKELGVDVLYHNYVFNVSEVLNEFYSTISGDERKERFVKSFENLSEYFVGNVCADYLIVKDGKVLIDLTKDDILKVGLTEEFYNDMLAEMKKINENDEMLSSFTQKKHDHVVSSVFFPYDMLSSFVNQNEIINDLIQKMKTRN